MLFLKRENNKLIIDTSNIKVIVVYMILVAVILIGGILYLGYRLISLEKEILEFSEVQEQTTEVLGEFVKENQSFKEMFIQDGSKGTGG
jgi:cell division protein FtsL